MGKMKEVFMMQQQHELDANEHLDDEYWYAKYLEECQAKEQINDHLRLSTVDLPNGSPDAGNDLGRRKNAESERHHNVDSLPF